MCWFGPEGRERQDVRVVFDYRQAATGSEILSLEQSFPASRVGECEFIISEDAYATGGRVLAWRVKLYRDEELVATRQSYLWE